MIISGKEFLGGKPAMVSQSAGETLTVPNEIEKKNIFQNFIERQKEILIGAEREKRIGSIVGDYAAGKQGLVKTGFQLGGETIRGAFESAAELPVIKQGLQLFGGAINLASQTSPFEKAGEAIEPMTSKIINWYENLLPENKRTVDSAVQWLSVLPVGKGLKVGMEVGVDITKTAFKGISKGVETIAPIFEKTASAIGKVGSYFQSRVPKLLGIFTGENDDVIRAAMVNPKAADAGIMGGDDALRNVVREGSENSVKMRDSFIQAHDKAIKQEVFQEMGVTPGWSRGMQQQIRKHFEDLLRANSVKYAEGKLDFSTSKIKANPGEISKINAAYEAIQSWTNWSQFGVHKLKQLIGQLTKFPTEVGGRAKSPMLGRMYGYLDEQVKAGLAKDRIAMYEELNSKFSNNIEYFDDLVDAFNSGDPFTRIANSLGKNKDSVRGLLEWYEKQSGKPVLPVVAGRELAMEKTAAFGFLNPRSWIDFFISPKIQAKIVTKVGEKVPIK